MRHGFRFGRAEADVGRERVEIEDHRVQSPEPVVVVRHESPSDRARQEDRADERWRGRTLELLARKVCRRTDCTIRSPAYASISGKTSVIRRVERLSVVGTESPDRSRARNLDQRTRSGPIGKDVVRVPRDREPLEHIERLGDGAALIEQDPGDGRVREVGHLDLGRREPSQLVIGDPVLVQPRGPSEDRARRNSTCAASLRSASCTAAAPASRGGSRSSRQALSPSEPALGATKLGLQPADGLRPPDVSRAPSVRCIPQGRYRFPSTTTQKPRNVMRSTGMPAASEAPLDLFGDVRAVPLGDTKRRLPFFGRVAFDPRQARP